MAIIHELSSQLGDKTEKSNKLVAEKCIAAPTLIIEIVDGLANSDKKIVADSAEVMTFISEEHPELVIPFIDKISVLFDHKDTKARWEATHTFAQVTATAPKAVKGFVDSLNKMALSDKSKIVQDYATIAIGNYGGSSKDAAVEALPLLSRILEVEGDRQAVRVIEGLSKLLAANASIQNDIRKVSQSQAGNTKSSIKHAYTKLTKQLG